MKSFENQSKLFLKFVWIVFSHEDLEFRIFVLENLPLCILRVCMYKNYFSILILASLHLQTKFMSANTIFEVSEKYNGRFKG